MTRSGGFAGITRRAEAETADDPDLDTLAEQIDLAAFGEPRPAPDRFVYTIEIGDARARVTEADLAGPLSELVQRLLAR